MAVAANGKSASPTHAFISLRDGVIPGAVCVFQFVGDGAGREIPVDEPVDVSAVQSPEWIWVHVNLADRRAAAWVTNLSVLPQPARALVAGSHSHQQLYATADCVYGVFSDLTRSLDHAADDMSHLNFAMTDRVVVTGRRQSLQAVEAVREALLAGRRVATPAAFIEAVVEQVTLGIDRLLTDLARTIDKIEDMVLVDAIEDERRRLGAVRRTGVQLHRQLAALRSLLQRFELSDEIALSPAIEINTDRLAQRLDDLDQEVRAAQERARLLQDEIGARLSEESARHLNALSILTALLLPATLITGIFGMNTSDLPFTHNAHGSWWAIALGLAAAATTYWLLRVLGVIKRSSKR